MAPNRIRDAAYWQMLKRSEEHTSELQSLTNLVCRLLLEKKKIDHQLLHQLTPTVVEPRQSAHPELMQRLETIASVVKSEEEKFVATLVSFFFNDTAPTEISPLPLHDALPISINPAGAPPDHQPHEPAEDDEDRGAHQHQAGESRGGVDRVHRSEERRGGK